MSTTSITVLTPDWFTHNPGGGDHPDHECPGPDSR